jgi:hypothetical protein
VMDSVTLPTKYECTCVKDERKNDVLSSLKLFLLKKLKPLLCETYAAQGRRSVFFLEKRENNVK